jgi:substrate import-associated zinc metallohydrolase lipoprotein
MNLNYIKIIAAFFLVTTLFSCAKEDDPDAALPGLGGETWIKGPLDNWLYDNFVVPYNIEVKYRFDRYEVSLDRVLTPPQEDKIIPVMETIIKTWIQPYEQVASPGFIKTLTPKQFVLVGSPSFNTDGTITLGTAEGGRKIVLYKINDFNKADKPEVKQMLHTIQHEFGHILHQNILYPPEFKSITTGYTASWADFSLTDARSRGFITEYARSAPDEDFVEMIATMLVEGRAGFNAQVSQIVLPDPADPAKRIPNAMAQAAIRNKEQMVVRYFKEAWNIDFYTLQTRAEAAINAL